MTARTRFRSAMLCFVLGAMGSGLGAGVEDDPLVQIVKFLFRPFKEQSARMDKADKFKDKTRKCIVITNESQQPWKFGCLGGEMKRELRDMPSGSMLVMQVKADGLTFEKPVGVNAETDPVTLGINYGTILIRPMCERPKRFSALNRFARVCYLEDANGRRVYLKITKDTYDTAVPVVGIADISNRVLMEQKVLEYSDKKLEQFNMIGIKVDQLKEQ